MKSRKIRKIITVLLTVVIFATMFVINSSARTISSYYNSPAATAGSWKSDSVHKMTSPNYDELYGGDIGVYFYSANVGLSDAFVKSTSRTAESKLMDEDVLSYEHIRTYTHTFGMVNGYYRTKTAVASYTNSSKIESDKQVESFLKFKINTVSNDTSKNIPSGLLCYQFWID